MDLPDSLSATQAAARETLLQEQTPEGHWEGCLSSSALSTATAVVALALFARETSLTRAQRLGQLELELEHLHRAAGARPNTITVAPGSPKPGSGRPQ